MTSGTIATERVPSARTQSVAITTAAFGQNVILTTVSTFILLYLVQFADFSSSAIVVASVILGVAKGIDAVSDPLVGTFIDRTSTRWGKFRPYVLFSALPVALLTTLLFSIPDTSEGAKLVYFGITYLLWGIAYSACDVPLWGLIGSAFGESASRVRVVSNVRAFGSISLGLVTLFMQPLALALSFSDNTTAQGWSLAVGITAFAGMGLYLLAFFKVRERKVPGKRSILTFRQLFGTLFKNTPLLMVLLGSILGFGRFIIQSGGALFVVIAYGKHFSFTLVGAAIIIGLVIASFCTPLVLRKVSGKMLMIWSSAIGAVLYLLMYLAGYENVVVVMTFTFLTGLTLGIFLVVQATMIADAVDDVEKRTGVRNDGISFSTLTFVSKLMTALAVLVFGVFIGASGYHEGVQVTAAMQQTVWIALTIVPGISCVLSIVPFVFYRLGGRTTAPVRPRSGR
ncbi:MAG TPA: glycoside-pentoside-hexuronide (GPH):cation symporter [Galbitalea sp.]|jgi:sugar (glycoside-pentoside-hexuronide) transporter